MALATLLFGANYWIAKGLMPDHLLPMQIIFLRVLGTFVIASAIQFGIRELRVLRVDRADIPRIILSSLLGVALNQMLFFSGLNHTTPVDAAIINSSNPILVLIFSVWILKEKVGLSRLAGILLGAAGALMLILFGNPGVQGTGHLSGNLMIIANTAAWSLYLVISKPLMVKYNPFLMMRWMFMCGLVAVLPFSISEVSRISFSSFGSYTWFSLIYIVVGTTFLAYFFITFSLKRLPASVVAYYTYLQPVIVATIGITLFAGSLNAVKILSALLVFAGIFLTTRRSRKAESVAKTGESEHMPEGQQ
jgi:drug/metabolite transporter (DMT)-like permease